MNIEERAYNSNNALLQMDWLTLAPMKIKKWLSRVTKREHASLLLNRYIIVVESEEGKFVKITEMGRRRLLE